MEEVDNIIIHSLRQVGCDIEEEIDSLKNFSTELVIEAAVRCLDVIHPGLGLPHSLPFSMSARFQVGASIAQACKNLGYNGDIGYQTFFYSSETDVRRVFVFLIEKLPKESEKSIVEPTGRIGLLEKAVSETVKKQLTSPWLPRYCRRRGLRWRDDGSWSREGCGHQHPFISCNLDVPKTTKSKELSQAWREYYVHHLPLVTEQVSNRHQLLPSLITLNAKGLLTPLQQAHGVTPNWETSGISQQLTECIARSLDGCSGAPGKESILTALHIQDNNKKRRKETNSRFVLSEKLQFTKESGKDKQSQETGEQQRTQLVTVTEKRREKEEEMQLAREEMGRLKQCLDSLELDVHKLTAKLSQMVVRPTTLQVFCKLLESVDGSAESDGVYERQITKEKSHDERALRIKAEEQTVKKRTYDLLPEADSNLSALQASVESNAETLVVLAAQWEKHRAPLLAQYRDARERNSNKASESQKKVDALCNLRDKSRELGEEVRHKEQLHSQLVAEYEKVTKDINRSAYTRRIMEIIGNIAKQKEDIDKVLKDTKELKKEINNLTGQLDRSFTIADELIFQDAKRDETARKAYKLLATLHSDCSDLVQMVEETGAIVREIRDLEEQIETESAKNVGANLDRISADLHQMKQETAALTAQLNVKS